MRRSTSRSPRGQLVELGVEVGRGRLGCLRKGVQHEPGQAGRENRIAGRDHGNGVEKFGCGDGLGHITAGAGPDGPYDVFGRVGHGKGQKTDVRLRSMDPPYYFGPPAIGDVHVHEHDVGHRLADQGHRGDRISRLADDVDLPPATELAVDLVPHAGAEKLVVVHEEQAQWRWGRDVQLWAFNPEPASATPMPPRSPVPASCALWPSHRCG